MAQATLAPAAGAGVQPRWPKAAGLLVQAEDDVRALIPFPIEVLRTRIDSTNLLQRPIQQVKRRTSGGRVLPDRASAARLAACVLLETFDTWHVGRGCFSRAGCGIARNPPHPHPIPREASRRNSFCADLNLHRPCPLQRGGDHISGGGGSLAPSPQILYPLSATLLGQPDGSSRREGQGVGQKGDLQHALGCDGQGDGTRASARCRASASPLGAGSLKDSPRVNEAVEAHPSRPLTRRRRRRLEHGPGGLNTVGCVAPTPHAVWAAGRRSTPRVESSAGAG